METERARTALVFDSAVTADHVHPVGPAGIRSFGRIVDVIDKRRNLDMEISDTGVRHSLALVEALRIRENNILAYIRFHLPQIARMRFLDVHDIKRHAIPVLLIQLIERGNLPAKGRSSIAAEDQDNGL